MFNDLKPGKHLLLDNNVVADWYRLDRLVHQPVRDQEPILTPQCDWEKSGPRMVHVLFDENRNCYRMWYMIRDAEKIAERKRRNGGMFGDPKPCSLCYAESVDGVRWEKPELGLYEGGKNNICFQGFSGGATNSMLVRPEAPGDQKYILVMSDWKNAGVGGTYLAFSEDGIHWKFRSDQAQIYGHSDTVNNLVYNPEREVFMMFMRPWHSLDKKWFQGWVGGPSIANYAGSGKNMRRRLAYSESRDLESWSEVQTIIVPDELDEDDLYGMTVFPYGDYYLGQLERYDDNRWGSIDIELAWSRDGFHWSRHPQRPAFIPCDKLDGDQNMAFPARVPVAAGDEMFLYYSAYDAPHDVEQRDVRAFRSRLRLDGFYSMAADRRLGGLLTRPFTLQSDTITINAQAISGEIRAELVEPYHEAGGEPHGKIIDGFTVEDSDSFRSDSTSYTLTWRGNSDLSALRGRRLMLKLKMYHAEVYSITL